MLTRSDRTFSIGENYSPIDHILNDRLNILIVGMDQRLWEFKDQGNTNCKDLATRLDKLEINRRRISDPLEENKPRDNSRSSWCRRAQPYNTEDTDAQYIKSVKVDAHSFDGHLDPQAYINWQLAMNRYFRWHDMSESKKIWFAMMKLTG